MCPKQGLGSCQKQIKAQGKGQGCILLPRGGEWVLPAASTKEPEEREFLVDFGASMHMGSKRDFNSAVLETMRTSRSPTTVMSANGEVQIREEATVYVKQLDLFVKVMLLEETPAVLSLGALRGSWVYEPRPAVEHHIPSKMARELIAIYPTMYHS